MKKLIVDVATGQRKEVELTSDDIARLEEENAAEAEVLASKESIKASAVAKLQALGLTVEEVQVAFGLEAE